MALKLEYEWLLAKLRDIFPPDTIRYDEWNHGTMVGIAYVNGDKKDGVLVENNGYSLNRDPLRDLIVDDLIVRWKVL